MSWAARRRFFILLVLGAIIVAIIALLSIATFYKTPSCTDGIQNQSEEGVDCGGPCPYLCTAMVEPPTILFTKALTNSAGRTDVIASVENKNASAAAKDVPYRITLYGANQALIQEAAGTIDLPPAATEPVFVPGVASGKQVVFGAFLSIDASAPQWFRVAGDPRIIPSVSSATEDGTASAPRVEAVLVNSSTSALSNVQAIVMVRGVQGDIIAASRTIVPSIPAQGRATAIFTWNNPFPSAPASIEVVPIIPLP
ncbi:MAG: hypothetical protein KGH56_02950 [Patescibacteria group bacterium]|nr:hypothetical protein [Patescibacteria group bacterium]